MNLSVLPKDLPIPEDDGACNHLFNKRLPDVSLPNQDGNLLKLNRKDTFRLVLYCYPMTGHPNKPLPPDWDHIPGARGCTPQNCSFRDHYDELIKLNAIPIGMTSQNTIDIKEMVSRLSIPYDLVSDENLEFTNKLNLPTFTIDKKIYIKRVTMIVEKSIIKKFFYPIFPPDLHIHEVIKWLRSN